MFEPNRSVWTTLPQHFKNAGFWTAGAGKLYHPGSPVNEDNPRSWSITYPPDVPGGCTCEAMANYCMLPENTTCPDVKYTNTVIQQLNQHKESGTEDPFFIGLGLHKPHLPWAAPQSFFDLYPPPEEIPIAQYPKLPAYLPPIAWHQCTWDAFPFWFSKNQTVNTTVAQHARRAYYAAASFADHLLGRVLTAIKTLGYANTTIVMLVGDHGWQLGHTTNPKFLNLTLSS